MNKKNLIKKTTTTSVAASLILLSSSHAVTIASDDFSSGAASGGSGWDNNWTTGSNGGSAGSVDLGALTTPLDGNGNYANIVGSGGNATQGIHRNYTSALSSGTNQEHTISFLFRLDTLPAATGDSSRGLVTHGATSFGLGGGSTWAFYVQNGNFFYFDGDGSGSFGGAATNSGVTAAVGDLYSVSINNRIGADATGPTTGGEWDLLVTNLTTSATVLDLTDLEFRTNTVPTNAFIGLGVAGNNVTSFDQLNVDVIPEPSSAILLGLGGFGLLIRRRK